MRALRVVLWLGLLAAVVMLCGCLASQYKEYHYRLNSDGSGEGVITYVNIVSQEDEEKDVSLKDFGELVDDCLEGSSFEDENPHLRLTDKKLYEKDGVLMGEVRFTFDNMDSIGFYRTSDCECSPYMFYLGSLSETYVESNGSYLGVNRDFPILIWEGDRDEFYFKTSILEDLSDCHSLLPLYKTWEESQ
jgi:hypothetical protein